MDSELARETGVIFLISIHHKHGSRLAFTLWAWEQTLALLTVLLLGSKALVWIFQMRLAVHSWPINLSLPSVDRSIHSDYSDWGDNRPISAISTILAQVF